jgi:hypothetical protein
MTTRPTLNPLASVAKAATQGTNAPNARSDTGNTRASSRQGEVQWGQANGSMYRFDPKADPRRTGASLSQPASRRLQALPGKRAGGASASGRSGRAGRSGRGATLSLGSESDFGDDDDDDDEGASIAGAGTAQGAGSQGQGGQDTQGQAGDGHSEQGNESHDTAGAGASASASDAFGFSGSGPAAGFGNDFNAAQMMRALASDDSSASLRERVLAAVPAPATTLRCAEALGKVRAALIEAVNAGELVPKVNPNSPDQNCLIPLVLLRASRPLPPAMRAMAEVRAAAMLSISARLRSARRDTFDPTLTP